MEHSRHTIAHVLLAQWFKQPISYKQLSVGGTACFMSSACIHDLVKYCVVGLWFTFQIGCLFFAASNPAVRPILNTMEGDDGWLGKVYGTETHKDKYWIIHMVDLYLTLTFGGTPWQVNICD